MRLLKLTCLAVLTSVASLSFAAEGKITHKQRTIMTCIDAMGTTTNSGQCVRLMFGAYAHN